MKLFAIQEVYGYKRIVLRGKLDRLSKSLGVASKVNVLGFREDVPELLSIFDDFAGFTTFASKLFFLTAQQ